MSVNLNKLKTIFSMKNLSLTGTANSDSEPQIGFKILYCESERELKVRVIGARHLPTVYGNVRPQGYLVKVRIFPGREKFETEIVKESWPCFGQDFVFPLPQPNRNLEDGLKGKFVSFTAYAILNNLDEIQKNSQKDSLKKRLKQLTGNVTGGSELKRGSKSRQSKRASLNNRRTIGAATYSLEAKFLTQRLKNDVLATPDIWREIKQISSGVVNNSKESKNGSIEMTMSYSISEDGKNDMFELSLSRLRCSIQTMEEHEKFGGQLYIKMTAFEYDLLISKLKSDRFEPTISLKIESKTSTLQAIVNRDNLSNVKFLIRLMCKNVVGKKFLLGKIEIDCKSEIWRRAVDRPSTEITECLNFE